jgi:hypothetical protein
MSGTSLERLMPAIAVNDLSKNLLRCAYPSLEKLGGSRAKEADS